MNPNAFASLPSSVTLYPGSGWTDLPSGVRVSSLALWDKNAEVFARLGHGGSTDTLLRDRAWRLPLVSELEELEALSLYIEPVTLPTKEQLAEVLIGAGDIASIDRFRNGHMQSFEWCALHDAEVFKRLAAAGWDGKQPVDNDGKHWALGGVIFGWRRKGKLRIQNASVFHKSNPQYRDYATTTHVVEIRTRRGMKGPHVRAFQSFLLHLGYQLPVYGADSEHGDETERAAIQWGADTNPHHSAATFDIDLALDDWAPNQPADSCSPIERLGTRLFRDWVLKNYGGGDLGIVRVCNPKDGLSEHEEGRAWDWGIVPGAALPGRLGQWPATVSWLLADLAANDHELFRRIGIQLQIYDRRILRAYPKGQLRRGQWSPYTGSDPHNTHIHFSLSRLAADGHGSFYKQLMRNPNFRVR